MSDHYRLYDIYDAVDDRRHKNKLEWREPCIRRHCLVAIITWWVTGRWMEQLTLATLTEWQVIMWHSLTDRCVWDAEVYRHEYWWACVTTYDCMFSQMKAFGCIYLGKSFFVILYKVIACDQFRYSCVISTIGTTEYNANMTFLLCFVFILRCWRFHYDKNQGCISIHTHRYIYIYMGWHLIG